MADLNTILERFGFATVLEPTFYEVGSDVPLFTLDSLSVANITQEGPTKTVKGGLYAETQMRYGKTMRLEMEDVVGRIEVLKRLMGAEVGVVQGATTDVKVFVATAGQTEFQIPGATAVTRVEKNDADLVVTTAYTFAAEKVTLVDAATAGDIIRIRYTIPAANVQKLKITDKFTPAVKIIGKTFIIDSRTGEKKWVKIHFPKFLPDGVFEMNMEAEGDFGTMAIGGELIANECGVFYEIYEGDAPAGC